MDKPTLTRLLKKEAQRLGFQMAGACPAVGPNGIHHFHQWLEAGFAGEMHYLANRAAAYEHPHNVLDGARSLLMLAMNYDSVESAPVAAGQGRVSRYAWGTRDYHDVIHQRLKQLKKSLLAEVPDATVRGVVDTAPLLEREFAQLAGLGWIGKHTLLLNQQQGSWFFLAALLTDLELDYDPPHQNNHCGTCTACLDACPTDAFPQPYVLDATRCISYLTIELDGAIPLDLRGGVSNWLFGCDICQDVCPWNRHAPPTSEEAYQPRSDTNPIELAELFYLGDEAFRRRFRKTPLWRPKRRGILRNAAIVLGNQSADEAIAALVHGLADCEAVVRGACAWALGQMSSDAARRALTERLSHESDDDVLEEIQRVLGGY